MRRVAIIGFGFSGLMAAANLLRAAVDASLTLYIIDEKLTARGVAYSTTNPQHLLNVRAGNMGAFADDIGGFAAWLQSVEAKQWQARFNIPGSFSAGDFAPRMLYGEYLQTIWQQTQATAAQKNLEIKLVPSHAVAITGGAPANVMTARGDAIAVDRVILAVGHETKIILPQTRSEKIVQNPWAETALDGAANWPSPVMLMGAGLTAVDMVLSLRRANYAGEIIMVSRHGKLPQHHAHPNGIYSFNEQEIAAHKNLRSLVRLVRKKITEYDDWRMIIDALRPHTQRLWQTLSTREQRRFLKFILPVWNIHRHRMAQSIAGHIDKEIAACTLKIIASKTFEAEVHAQQLHVIMNDVSYHPSHILNCTGIELNPAHSANVLLRQLLADGLVEPHATNLGIAADKHCRAWGNVYPQLYTIGSLMTGQLFESTAVPELRAQAAAIAQAMMASDDTNDESPAAIARDRYN